MNSSPLSRAAAGFVAGAAGLLLASALLSVNTEPTFAAKGGNGNGGGGNESNFYVVVVNHIDNSPWGGTAPADLYAPGELCMGETVGTAYNFFMPHDGNSPGDPCGIVQLYDLGGSDPNGIELRDGVGFDVTKGKGQDKGYLTGVTIHGQDQTGPAGIYHEGIEALLTEAVEAPAPGGEAILHVHSQVPVHTTDRHLSGGRLLEVVGYVSIGDIKYTAKP